MSKHWLDIDLPQDYQQRIESRLMPEVDRNRKTSWFAMPLRIGLTTTTTAAIALGFYLWRQPTEIKTTAEKPPQEIKRVSPEPVHLETEMLRHASVISIHKLLLDLDVLEKWNPRSREYSLFSFLIGDAQADSGQLLSESDTEIDSPDMLEQLRPQKTRAQLLAEFKTRPKEEQEKIRSLYVSWKKLSSPTKKILYKRHRRWTNLSAQQRRSLVAKYDQWAELSEKQRKKIRMRLRRAA